MTEQELLNKGYRKYTGKEVDIFFNLDMCEHAGICIGTLPQVFNVSRKPWIKPDNGTVDDIEFTIKGCPSGALQYIKK